MSPSVQVSLAPAVPQRRSRRSGLVAAVCSCLLALLLMPSGANAAEPVDPAAQGRQPSGPRAVIPPGQAPAGVASLSPWTGAMNVYTAGAFVGQKRSTWCVAAATQTMLNMARDGRDTSYATQSRLMSYAKAHDTLRSSLGSDPRGWVRALNEFGGLAYADRAYSSYTAALKAAVTRMRVTGYPVGLLVAGGSHAWVLHGFRATADPAVTSSFTVTAVYISGPLYPLYAGGYDRRPNTPMSPTTLARSFTKYWQRDGYSGWVGRWVIVSP